MPALCPQCQSRKTTSIKATQRLALCAEAVNLLILSRLKACYPSVPTSAAYQTLEKLSQNLVEALAKSVQLKLQNIADDDLHTHVCLSCGRTFDLLS
jgi:Fe2+ or Zn2+ uptake regulation protein